MIVPPKLILLLLTSLGSAALLLVSCAVPDASTSTVSTSTGAQTAVLTQSIAVSSSGELSIVPSGTSQSRDMKARKTGQQSPFMVTTNGAEMFSGVGAEVAVPDPGVEASISETNAIGILAKSGFVKELAGTANPSLRLVEYENVFGAIGADGSMTPSVTRQVAWFATYSNLSSPGPHSEPAGSTVAFDTPANCTVYVAVSANDGSLLDSFDYCGAN